MRTNYKISAIAAFMIFISHAALSFSSENVVGEYNDGYNGYGHGKKVVVNNHYSNNMYDFQYSSRIKRFHGPYVSVEYYGSCYTDAYWYSYEPAYFSGSIYREPFWSGVYFGISFINPYYRSYYRL